MACSIPRRGGIVSEINVTPLADVMLVLLIIFMVTIPLIDAGHVKSLPVADRAEKRSAPIEISVARAGSLFLGGRLVSAPELSRSLTRLLLDSAHESAPVVLKADAALEYGSVRDVLRRCREAGVEEIVLAARSRVE